MKNVSFYKIVDHLFFAKKMNAYPADHWKFLPNGKIECELCPRRCKLNDGQKGLCFVRQRVGEQLVLTTYGKSSGFAIDPIEKKPLNHFYPGSSVLSFGTAGCNLSCKFCQNWDISHSKAFDRLTEKASPSQIAEAAKRHHCTSVALTYNDPIVFLEYGRDVVLECKAQGIKTVAVTNGYINPKPRADFFPLMDAVNVDLKAFTETFYKELTGGDLETVLETLKFIKKETTTWLEITTLLIPGRNDSIEEIFEMSNWILENLGDEVPLHFSAFHPAYKMRDVQTTPLETLVKARDIAMKVGLKFIYTGNVYYRAGEITFCPACHTTLIERDVFDILTYHLDHTGTCLQCGCTIPGFFSDQQKR